MNEMNTGKITVNGLFKLQIIVNLLAQVCPKWSLRITAAIHGVSFDPKSTD